MNAPDSLVAETALRATKQGNAHAKEPAPAILDAIQFAAPLLFEAGYRQALETLKAEFEVELSGDDGDVWYHGLGWAHSQVSAALSNLGEDEQ